MLKHLLRGSFQRTFAWKIVAGRQVFLFAPKHPQLQVKTLLSSSFTTTKPSQSQELNEQSCNDQIKQNNVITSQPQPDIIKEITAEIPLGQSQFQLLSKLIGYVDNTKLLSDIYEDSSWQVGQFYQPRCWGKTSKLSMIQFCGKLGFRLQRCILQLMKQLRYLQQSLDKLRQQKTTIQKNHKTYSQQNILISKELLAKDKKEKSRIKEQLKLIDDLIKNHQRRIDYKKSQEETLQKQIKKVQNQIEKNKEILSKKEYLSESFKQKAIYKNIVQNFEIYDSVPIIKICFVSNGREEQIIHDYKENISMIYQQHAYVFQEIQKQMEGETSKSAKQQLQDDLNGIFRIIGYQSKFQRRFSKQNNTLSMSQLSQQLFPLTDFTNSIMNLCRLIHKYLKKKPIILIDQFDLAYISNIGKPFQQNFFKILNNFYVTTLKGQNQEYFFKAVTMGIVPIKYCNQLSQLNNPLYLNMATPLRSFYPGFTEEQVDEKLTTFLSTKKAQFRDNNHFQQILKSQKAELKAWANGYWVSGKEIYNPWTINHCLKEIMLTPVSTWPRRLFSPSWRSGHLSLIKKIILSSDKLAEEMIRSFVLQKFTHREIFDYSQQLPVENLMKTSSLFFLLFHTGYLTRDRSRPKVYVLPNRQTATCFYDDIFMTLLKKRYPELSGHLLKLQIRELFENVEDFQSVRKGLKQLINFFITNRKLPMKEGGSQSMRVADIDIDVADIDIDRLFEKLIKSYEEDVRSHIGYFQAQNEMAPMYDGYIGKFEVSTEDQTRMDRFFFSASKDMAIIHEDMIIRSQDTFDEAMCTALKQILDKYLKHAQQTREKCINEQQRKSSKIEELKYIQVTGFVICQDTSKYLSNDVYRTKWSPYLAQVRAESYTFTIQKANQLLENYKKDFLDKQEKNQDQKEETFSDKKQREKLRKMLKAHSCERKLQHSVGGSHNRQ